MIPLPNYEVQYIHHVQYEAHLEDNMERMFEIDECDEEEDNAPERWMDKVPN
jgi:hypothetical protein